MLPRKIAQKKVKPREELLEESDSDFRGPPPAKIVKESFE